MDHLNQIGEYLQQGDVENVHKATQSALDQDIPPEDILDQGLIAGMQVIGEQFKNHEIFLPNVLLAAKAMYAGMDLLKPLFIEQGIPSRGKIVIGTVKGDLHDIGKNLVGIMLKGAGYDVIDLGRDVPVDRFVETAAEEKAEIIGMSALLTTTQPMMKHVLDRLKELGLDGSIKTIIGGAPLSKEYAQEIGATSFAYDASNAVDVVNQLMSKN